MSESAGALRDRPASSAPGLRVLVVDDTADIRFLLRLTLERDGRFEVVGEAGDGAEAIVAAARLRPDVVLLDLAMPVMDGLEALPQIRAQSAESKIVVLSGFNAREMSADALARGASSYLEKGGIADLLVPHILHHFPDRHDAPPVATDPVATDPVATDPVAGDRLAAVEPAGRQAAAPQVPPATDLADEWVSVLAHELNNPVTILQGFALLLQQATDSMSQDAIKESAAAISRAAKHLGALVEAFADLRKIEINSLDLVLEAADVSELVRETITDMAEVTGTHPVILEVVEGVHASIDPPRVRQVLINLLANAAKFSPDATRIEVRVAVDGDYATISVRDHGPGIPVDKMSELFRKFSRLDPTIDGTGVGLFLSRGIARAHGGDLILAESSAPGCRFVLRLPLLRAVAAPVTPLAP